MGDVLARDLERRPTLARCDVDFLRLELEALGRDRDGSRPRGSSRPRTAPRPRSGSRENRENREDPKRRLLHEASPFLRSCWAPTVPAYSRSVSSTSSTAGRIRGASADTRRTPRFWNGLDRIERDRLLRSRRLRIREGEDERARGVVHGVCPPRAGARDGCARRGRSRSRRARARSSPGRRRT